MSVRCATRFLAMLVLPDGAGDHLPTARRVAHPHPGTPYTTAARCAGLSLASGSRRDRGTAKASTDPRRRSSPTDMAAGVFGLGIGDSATVRSGKLALHCCNRPPAPRLLRSTSSGPRHRGSAPRDSHGRRARPHTLALRASGAPRASPRGADGLDVRPIARACAEAGIEHQRDDSSRLPSARRGRSPPPLSDARHGHQRRVARGVAARR